MSAQVPELIEVKISNNAITLIREGTLGQGQADPSIDNDEMLEYPQFYPNGSYARRLPLPADVDCGAARAALSDGALQVFQNIKNQCQ